jgi:hypothetical protein
MTLTIIVKKKNFLKKERKQKKNTTTETGTNVRARGLNAGLLARSRFASEMSCDRPTPSRFSVVFFGLSAKVELVLKFYVALNAYHAALPIVTLKMSPYTNFDF